MKTVALTKGTKDGGVLDLLARVAFLHISFLDHMVYVMINRCGPSTFFFFFFSLSERGPVSDATSANISYNLFTNEN